MAFTVEDGTGVADANSYATVEFADAYFAERNVAGWTGEEAAKQSALIKATDYIDMRFSARFRGVPAADDQSLAWPRSYAYNSYGAEFPTIPLQLKRSCCEYALRALSGELAPDPTSSDGAVESLKEKVGPIETETKYVPGGQVAALFKPYPVADSLLRPLLLSGGVIR